MAHAGLGTKEIMRLREDKDLFLMPNIIHPVAEMRKIKAIPV